MIEKYKSIRKLRSEDGRFPIESELNPIIFIWVEDGNVEVGYCKKGDDTAKKEMLSFISELESKNITYRIIGSWTGKMSTDTFKFDSEEFASRLDK